MCVVCEVEASRGSAIKVEGAFDVEIAVCESVGEFVEGQCGGGADDEQDVACIVECDGAAAGALVVLVARCGDAAGEDEHWEGLERLFERFFGVVGVVTQGVDGDMPIRCDGEHTAEAFVAVAAGGAVADNEGGAVVVFGEKAAVDGEQGLFLGGPGAEAARVVGVIGDA